MNTLSKIASSHPSAPAPKASETASPAVKPSKAQPMNIPPALSTSALAVPGNADNQNLGLSEQQLKRQGLESMVAVLRSLVTWGTASGSGSAKLESSVVGGDAPPETGVTTSSTRGSNGEDLVSASDVSLDKLTAPSSQANGSDVPRVPTPDGADNPAADDPSRFENAKQRKMILQEGLKRFNYKPKKGIQFLLENGFIPSRQPNDVARFLLDTDGLNKAIIGEYLGEGCGHFFSNFEMIFFY